MMTQHLHPHSLQEAIEAMDPTSKLESAFSALEFKTPLSEIQDNFDQLCKSFEFPHFESPMNALQALDPFQVHLKNLSPWKQLGE